MVTALELRGVLEETMTKPLALDTETTRDGRLIGLSLCWKEGQDYRTLYCPANLDNLKEIVYALRLRDRGYITHWGKYDAKVLRRVGYRMRVEFDTYAAAKLILYDMKEGFGLKDLAERFFGVKMQRIEEVLGDKQDMSEVAPAVIEPYARADAEYTYKLHEVFSPLLENRNLVPLHQAESTLMHVIAELELFGISFDSSVMGEIKAGLLREREELKKSIAEWIPVQVLNSPQALSHQLFGVLKLPTEGVPKGKMGFYSTANGVLENLHHPVVEKIQAWRKVSKLLSTYTDSLMTSSRDGVIHTTLDSFGAGTGRMASSGPNLQNIPVKGAGIIIRKAFVARPGRVLLSIDYSMIETYCTAVLANDKRLISLLEDGMDVHREVAAFCLGVHPSQVTKEQRQAAKRPNFGITFGGGPSLFSDFTSDPAQQQVLLRRWFQMFPGIQAYINSVWRQVDKGFNETYFHRKRALYKLSSSASNKSKAALVRLLVNGDVQGTAADIVKIGMARVGDWCDMRPEVDLLLQVHDELILEVDENKVVDVAEQVSRLMVGVEFPIQLRVECEYGKNWLELLPVPTGSP